MQRLYRDYVDSLLTLHPNPSRKPIAGTAGLRLADLDKMRNLPKLGFGIYRASLVPVGFLGLYRVYGTYRRHRV